MSPDGSFVYVANSASASVSVVSVGSGTLAGTIVIPGGDATPWGAAVSPDSATIYVADRGQAQIEIIQASTGSVAGTIATGSSPVAVAFSPDGSRAYVANSGDGTVTVIDTSAKAAIGTVTVGPVPTELAVSPDGRTLYVANSNTQATPAAGTVSVVSTATNQVTATIPVGLAPDGLTISPDGAQLYVVNTGSNNVSVVSTASNSAINTIPVGQAPHGRGIFLGPATSSLAASVLPGGRSVSSGTNPTVFATIVNTASGQANGCQIGLPADAPAGLSLSYQTTNPATNAPTGQPDTPAVIAGNDGYQTYLLVLKAAQPLAVTNQALEFFCDGIQPAPVVVGVNTLDLTVSATPVADIVALAAVATGDGTVHAANGGSGAFAVATVNLGAAAALTASADTGSATLPATVSLCQTDPTTGQCLAPPASTVAYSATANGTPTFSVFVTASGPIDFAPGTARIFVRFKDAGGASHGATSVAVVAQ
jgi:YVTN family beta-propeller protein